MMGRDFMIHHPTSNLLKLRSLGKISLRPPCPDSFYDVMERHGDDVKVENSFIFPSRASLFNGGDDGQTNLRKVLLQKISTF